MLLTSALALAWFWRCKNRRTERRTQEYLAEHAEYFSGPYGSVLSFFPGAGDKQEATIACVTHPFVPDIEAEEEEFRDRCLELGEGDVVEVVAGGGAWLYGRVVGMPERAGFFPESRVSWVGRPMAGVPLPNTVGQSDPIAQGMVDTNADHVQLNVETPTSHTAGVALGTPRHDDLFQTERSGSPVGPPIGANDEDIGPLVRVTSAFSRHEVEGQDDVSRNSLTVEGGELLQVLAVGAGWVYGQMCDNPAKVGYVPEDRVEWVSHNTNCPEAHVPEPSTQ